MQQEIEKELNSQNLIKFGRHNHYATEPVIVEENQKQNWQNFCEQVLNEFAITWGEDECSNSTEKKSYFFFSNKKLNLSRTLNFVLF